MFLAIYLIILFAATAMMVREGLWSNSIALINIIISGLVAFGFYARLTIILDEKLGGQYTYLLDFIVIWFLYAVTMVICRTITVAASKTRMRFKYPIDPIGGPVLGFLAAWVLASLVMATLHAAPMGKDAFGGGLVKPADVESASAFTSPDAAWLRFVEKMTAPVALGGSSAGQFKAQAWVKIYQEHRSQFEAAPGIRVPRPS
jgi:Colicin V production protein